MRKFVEIFLFSLVSTRIIVVVATLVAALATNILADLITEYDDELSGWSFIGMSIAVLFLLASTWAIFIAESEMMVLSRWGQGATATQAQGSLWTDRMNFVPLLCSGLLLVFGAVLFVLVADPRGV